MDKTIQIPKRLQRTFHLAEVSRQVDEENRTVTFSLTSEEPIEDWPGEYMILDHSEGSVRLDRLRTAAPLLFNHDRDKHIGKIIGAEIVDRKLRVTAKFGNSQYAQEKFRDVVDGILTEVSASASINRAVLEEVGNDEGETYRAIDWEPLEASLVTVPADITVGVSRSELKHPDDFLTIKRTMSKEAETPEKKDEVQRSAPEAQKPVIEFKTDPEEVQRSVKAERQRVSSIQSLASKYNVDGEVVRDYIEGDKPLADFQDHILRNHLKAKEVETTSSELGLSKREREQYSLVRAMNCIASGKELDGLEGEAHKAMTERLKRSANGFFVPTDISHFGKTSQRDLSTDVASKGGYTVGTDVLGSSLVELLRNKTMLNALGVRTMSGLRGNVAIPKQDGGATAYWLAEDEEVSSSDQSFGQIGLTPHRLVGDTAYSKQLLAQSSISVESFVRDDLMRVLAIAKDLAGINGSGVDGEPLGILNTTGINTVTFGAAATFAKMIEFETEVATDNADVGNMAYLTTPATRGKLKSKSVDTGSGVFVWMNNMVNGYRAEATNQVPSNKVIFGNWADAMFADWDGMDVVVDPYSLKKKGQIEVTITLMTDFAVRHAESFAASTDSGAQ